LERLKEKINIFLNYGIAIYPSEVEIKETLIKQAEQELKSKKNCI